MNFTAWYSLETALFDTSLQALWAWILEFEMSVHRNRITGKVFRRRRQTHTDANRTDGAAQIVASDSKQLTLHTVVYYYCVECQFFWIRRCLPKNWTLYVCSLILMLNWKFYLIAVVIYIVKHDVRETMINFIYSEKATKFCEISTNYFTGRTNNWWRFHKILWPSQNIWTLLKTNITEAELPYKNWQGLDSFSYYDIIGPYWF